MSEINFVAKDKTDKPAVTRVRRLVKVITTGGLVVYLVSAAGVLGWWWWTARSQEMISSQIEEYTRQLAEYSEADVLARRLSSRAIAVNDYLDGRGEAADAAQLLVGREDVVVVGWDYTVDGRQEVVVTAKNPEEIKAFADYIAEKYTNVQIDEVSWNFDRGWIGRLVVFGRRQKV